MPKQESPEKHLETEEEAALPRQSEQQPKEYGGARGVDPTRYGDWEKNGRCIDF